MYDLIGVPYSSTARPGGIADAIAVLREEGLAERLGAHDAGDLERFEGEAVRGPSGLLKEDALGAVPGRPAVLTHGDVAMLGPRDREELAAAGVASLRGAVAHFSDDQGARAPGAAERAIAAIDGPFWLRVDLDVLRTEDFPAADYLQPGGLTWEELSAIAATALSDGRCLGASVVIYNPDLDPQRVSARRIVSFLAGLVVVDAQQG